MHVAASIRRHPENPGQNSRQRWITRATIQLEKLAAFPKPNRHRLPLVFNSSERLAQGYFRPAGFSRLPLYILFPFRWILRELMLYFVPTATFVFFPTCSHVACQSFLRNVLLHSRKQPFLLPSPWVLGGERGSTKTSRRRRIVESRWFEDFHPEGKAQG